MGSIEAPSEIEPVEWFENFMKILVKSLAILLFIGSSFFFVGIVYWLFVEPRFVAEPAIFFLVLFIPAWILWKNVKS